MTASFASGPVRVTSTPNCRNLPRGSQPGRLNFALHAAYGGRGAAPKSHLESTAQPDRKSVVQGKSVSVRVDLGGRRIIKTKHIRPTMSKKQNTRRCTAQHNQ